jgi:hypothetical protein
LELSSFHQITVDLFTLPHIFYEPGYTRGLWVGRVDFKRFLDKGQSGTPVLLRQKSGVFHENRFERRANRGIAITEFARGTQFLNGCGPIAGAR